MEDEVTIRRMTKDELAVAVEWAASEGWNPGLDDAGAFYAADPDGFLVAETLEEGIVGTISAVAYGSEFGFVGFYIVKPGFRGHQIGWMLGEKAMAHLGLRNVGIDGVLAKQRQYAKFFGFEFAYRNIRFGGSIPPVSPDPAIVPAADVPFERISAFDQRYFPAPREEFLRTWLSMPHSAARVFLRNGEVAGLGVIRECRTGFKIGPLFVESPEIAESVFRALGNHANGAEVFLDVPEVNAAGMAMANRHGMKEVFATARMYSRSIPDLPIDQIFGVTTFELG